jgi:hypothetical protein
MTFMKPILGCFTFLRDGYHGLRTGQHVHQGSLQWRLSLLQGRPKAWDNKLTVSSVLELKGPKKQWDELEIPPKSVTAISYGQEAHRRVGTMIALAILVALVRYSVCSTRPVCITSEFSTARLMVRMEVFFFRATNRTIEQCWSHSKVSTMFRFR